MEWESVSAAMCFENSAECWLHLQAHYDLKMARSSLSPVTKARIKSQRVA